MKKAPAKRQRRSVEAAYDPAGKPICPECFSRPSVHKRRERAGTGRHGWGITLEPELIRTAGDLHNVIRTRYPCANDDCPCDIEVLSLVAKIGSVEAHTPFAAKRSLKGAKLQRFLTGTTGRNGVWVAKDLPPEAPAPPTPRPRKPRRK